MEIIPYSNDALRKACLMLREGRVIAHATETCYGFACDLSNPDAVARLFALKKRPTDQPVSALFASLDQVKDYVEWSDRAEELAQQHLPGPLTLILPLRANTPTHIFSVPQGEKSTIGVRFSSHVHAQTLVQTFGTPLSTTSVNIHGKPNTYSTRDIVEQFAHEEWEPDLILNGGSLPITPPSTVINLTSEKTLRQGSVQL